MQKRVLSPLTEISVQKNTELLSCLLTRSQISKASLWGAAHMQSHHQEGAQGKQIVSVTTIDHHQHCLF